jgi:hypothetical protein
MDFTPRLFVFTSLRTAARVAGPCCTAATLPALLSLGREQKRGILRLHGNLFRRAKPLM